MEKPFLRPTWAEVDLTKYEANLRKVRGMVGPDVKILGILKALALGKFAEEKQLCQFFGVASVEEGLELRAAGLKTPILVLGSIYPFEAFEYAIKNKLAVTIASLDAAHAVADIAAKLGIKALCHVKQDTGMALQLQSH